jgi:histidinol-phosphatase (PHP family)
MLEFHTHTYRCKHAQGDIPDLARQAEQVGYTVLGISDHAPLPKDQNIEIRMSLNEVDDYIQAFHTAQEAHPGLKMFLGMESEHFKDYEGFYKEELFGKWGMDYLILAQHLFHCEGSLVYFWREKPGADKKVLKAYAEAVVAGIESKVFSLLAHPDLFGVFYAPWDEESAACSHYIIEAAQAYKLPLEINGNGFRKGITDICGIKRFQYPLDPFWEIASAYDVKVVVNSDAHHPSELKPSAEGLALAERYQLKFAELSDIRLREKEKAVKDGAFSGIEP